MLSPRLVAALAALTLGGSPEGLAALVESGANEGQASIGTATPTTRLSTDDHRTTCTLYSNRATYRPLAPNAGEATYSLFIPNDPALVGLLFTNQVLAADPAGSGLVVSNATVGVIGSK